LKSTGAGKYLKEWKKEI